MCDVPHDREHFAGLGACECRVRQEYLVEERTAIALAFPRDGPVCHLLTALEVQPASESDQHNASNCCPGYLTELIGADARKQNTATSLSLDAVHWSIRRIPIGVLLGPAAVGPRLSPVFHTHVFESLASLHRVASCASTEATLATADAAEFIDGSHVPAGRATVQAAELWNVVLACGSLPVNIVVIQANSRLQLFWHD